MVRMDTSRDARRDQNTSEERIRRRYHLREEEKYRSRDVSTVSTETAITTTKDEVHDTVVSWTSRAEHYCGCPEQNYYCICRIAPAFSSPIPLNSARRHHDLCFCSIYFLLLVHPILSYLRIHLLESITFKCDVGEK